MTDAAGPGESNRPPPASPAAAANDVPASAIPVVPGLVSVVMPMRNCEAYVDAALRSILAQHGVDLEVVVVDDGSTDRSADVVRSVGDPRVRMIPGPRAGIAAALNAGLAVARGEFFARCDADDLYAPDHMAPQLALLRERPEFGAVAGAFTYVNEAGEQIAAKRWNPSAEEITDELRSGVGRTHLGTFVVRMEHLRRLGGFRPYFVGTEDADFQLRLGEVCRVWWEPRPAYVYRLHGASITHTQPSAERRFLDRMARQFQKQRLATGQDDLMRGCPPKPPPKDASNQGGGRAVAMSTDAQVQKLLLGQAWDAHRAGRRGEALRTAWRACVGRPGNLSAWKSLAALAIKPARPARP